MKPHFRIIGMVLIAFEISTAAAAPLPSDQGSTVPAIGKCAYINAYYAKCWWRRHKSDTSTNYKLGYLTASDPLHKRREKYCQETERVIDGDFIIESCGIVATMFQRFTFWVGSVNDCNVTTESCVTSSRSVDVIFTCSKERVKLTIPPWSLDIDSVAKSLSWKAPHRDNSMLDFVLRTSRKPLYRVEIRELEDGIIKDWEEWYRGYDRRTFLPVFVPGLSYEIRVSASLDAPSPPFGEPSTPIPDEEREWTEPSNVLVYMAPRSLKVAEAGHEARYKEGKGWPQEIQFFDEVNSSMTVDDVTKQKEETHRKIIVISSIVSFILILVLAVVACFIPWQKWCCKLSETKFIKPKTFIDLEKSDKNSEDHSKSGKMQEEVFPITEVIPDMKHNMTFGKNPDEANIIYALMQNESELPSYTRSVLSPDVMESANTDHVTPDDIIKLDEITKETGYPKRYVRSLLPNSSIRYVQFGHESQDVPSYLMTLNSNDDTIMPGILHRTTSEYVIDDTVNDSAFTNDVSCATDMTSFADYDEKKHKQWQKYIAETSQRDNFDDIPDYVTHVPSYDDDFSQDITNFISMVAEDVTSQKSLDLSEETNEFILGCQVNEKQSISQILDATISHNSETHHKDIDVTSCVSCNTSQSAENKNAVIMNKRGSMSQNSIDSGYSPDSPDYSAVVPPDKRRLISNVVSMTISESDVSDEETDYMTYVTT